MTKPRRRVDGYIWRQEIARLHQNFDQQRRLVDRLLSALDERPLSALILLASVAQLSQTINVGLQALHELENMNDLEEGNDS